MRWMARISLLVVVGYLPSNAATATPALHTIAMSGQQAPGAAESFVAFLRPPALNNGGKVAFRATITGPRVSESPKQGIWTGTAQSLSNVFQSGEPAPGVPPGVVFSYFDDPLLNDDAAIVFRAGLHGPGIDSANNYGLWLDRSGVPNIIAQLGDPAPEMELGTIFSYIYFPLVNATGEVVYPALLSDSSSPNAQSLWLGSHGTLSAIALAGTQAPGLPSGTEFSSFLPPSAGGVSFNSSGDVVFSGQAGRGHAGAWRAREEATELMLATQQPAPGTGPGVTITDIGSVSLNEAGDVLINGSVRDPNRSIAFDNAVWVLSGSDTQLIARTGDPAPELPEDTRLESVGANLNRRNQVVLSALVSGPGINAGNNYALWKRNPLGEFTLLAHEGDPAPGFASQVYFAGSVPQTPDIYPKLTINSRGQVAFILDYRLTANVSHDTSNGTAIWAEDIAGNLQLIAATGQDLEIAPGDLRTVSSLLFQGSGNNESGRRSGFNDRGQLAFWASFTDGTSGIFVSDRVAVPEPCTLVWIVPILLLSVRRR